MIRFLLSVGVSLITSVIAFLITNAVVGGFHVTLSGFIFAVLIFTASQAILGPFVFNMARKYADAVLGGVGLISTFLSLLLTTLIGDSLRIVGASAWIASVVLVWLLNALGTWILGFFLITRFLARREERAKHAAVDAAVDRRLGDAK